MKGPQIDAAAARQRARLFVQVAWPRLGPFIREYLEVWHSPLVPLAIRSLAVVLPLPGATELSFQLLNYLRGWRELSSEELQGRLLGLLELLPDDQIERWGGVLAWVLTGTSSSPAKLSLSPASGEAESPV